MSSTTLSINARPASERGGNASFRWRFAVPAVGLYTALLLLVTWRHEMWRDELQAWLIARDSATLQVLFHFGKSPYSGIRSSPIFCRLRLPWPGAVLRHCFGRPAQDQRDVLFLCAGLSYTGIPPRPQGHRRTGNPSHFLLSETGYAAEREVLEEMKELGGTTLVITNQADAVVRRNADFLVELKLEVPGMRKTCRLPRHLPVVGALHRIEERLRYRPAAKSVAGRDPQRENVKKLGSLST